MVSNVRLSLGYVHLLTVFLDIVSPFLVDFPHCLWPFVHPYEVKGKKVKESIAVNGTPSHSYGVSLAVWDHTVLPATRHKQTHPTFTPARQSGT